MTCEQLEKGIEIRHKLEAIQEMIGIVTSDPHPIISNQSFRRQANFIGLGSEIEEELKGVLKDFLYTKLNVLSNEFDKLQEVL